jgi:positive phototaxis protein PixI
MNQIINKMPPPATQQLLTKIPAAVEEHQRFLGLTIGNSLNALIPLVNLQATIKISLAEILPVPQMNDSLLGIINYGGKATWVVDLARLMGGSGYADTPDVSTCMGLLFEVQNETVALSIDRVGTIETYNLQECLPIGDAMFTEQIRLFLSGYFVDTQQQSRVVIDLQQVIKSII